MNLHSGFLCGHDVPYPQTASKQPTGAELSSYLFLPSGPSVPLPAEYPSAGGHAVDAGSPRPWGSGAIPAPTILGVIDALVFDFDGTVLETESAEFSAWEEIYATFGATLGRQEWSACIGRRGGFDPYAVLAGRATMPLPTDDELRAMKCSRVVELLEPVGPRPGVLDWIEKARCLGLPVGLASSSPREWVDCHLQRLGLRAHFDVVACCDESLRAKPEPDTYLAACGALDADPASSVAVEDSPNGLTAAARAGLFCVAVPNDMTRDLALNVAHLVVDSLVGLPLEHVVALAGRRRALAGAHP